MSSFKVDGRFAFHPKAGAVGNAALGLWVRAGSWCSLHSTDGHIPLGIAKALGTGREAERLVDAGLWIRADDGYQFHQWRRWQDRLNIGRAIRESVLDRDGGQCVFCGSTTNLSLDHIVRYRDGGGDTADNLRVLCMPCNLGREGPA